MKQGSHYCFVPEHERLLRHLMCVLENYFVARSFPDAEIAQPTRDDCKYLMDCLFDVFKSFWSTSGLMQKLS